MDLLNTCALQAEEDPESVPGRHVKAATEAGLDPKVDFAGNNMPAKKVTTRMRLLFSSAPPCS